MKPTRCDQYLFGVNKRSVPRVKPYLSENTCLRPPAKSYLNANVKGVDSNTKQQAKSWSKIRVRAGVILPHIYTHTNTHTSSNQRVRAGVILPRLGTLISHSGANRTDICSMRLLQTLFRAKLHLSSPLIQQGGSPARTTPLLVSARESGCLNCSAALRARQC